MAKPKSVGKGGSMKKKEREKTKRYFDMMQFLLNLQDDLQNRGFEIKLSIVKVDD